MMFFWILRVPYGIVKNRAFNGQFSDPHTANRSQQAVLFM